MRLLICIEKMRIIKINEEEDLITTKAKQIINIMFDSKTKTFKKSCSLCQAWLWGPLEKCDGGALYNYFLNFRRKWLSILKIAIEGAVIIMIVFAIFGVEILFREGIRGVNHS